MSGLWQYAGYGLLAYAMLTLAVFFSQRQLLYHPNGFRLSAAQAGELGLAHWPSSDDYRGLRTALAPAVVNGTVVVLHGNAGSAAQRSYLVEALTRRRLRVLIAEYPGYGGRAGSPSEASLVADVVDTINQARAEFGVPLYLWGESLGAGVAAAAAARLAVPADGLVMFTPWDSLPALAQTHYWYLPARWLTRDRFDSVANLATFSGRVAVVLAGQDRVIPPHHGEVLFQSLTGQKRRWLFEQAGHNNWPSSPDALWWDEVIGFLRGV